MLGTVDKITNLIKPVVQDIGYELVGVEYITSGKNSVLRVFIDVEWGVNINDCEIISRQISSIFEVEDPISGHYNLEVSSPGIERPLFTISHYQRFLGNNVKLRLVRSMNGQRKFKGAIASVSELNNSIELATELGSITLDIDMIDKANLVADF